MKTDFLISLSGIDLMAIFLAAFVVADGIFGVAGVGVEDSAKDDGGLSVPSEFPLLSVEYRRGMCVVDTAAIVRNVS